ncbi:hypothetical protein AB7M29_004642 [Pseudomonas sp. F-14 TE3623]
MMTDTGMNTVGMIVETIGAETTGVEITGVESKPAEKQNAIVIGNAVKIGPCGTATKTITATIVASATPRDQPPATHR